MPDAARTPVPRHALFAAARNRHRFRRKHDQEVLTNEYRARDESATKSARLVVVALLAMGAAALGHERCSRTTTENIHRVGPISATAERTHNLSIPPLGGGANWRFRHCRTRSEAQSAAA